MSYRARKFSPENLAKQFEAPHIATYGATCPVCKQPGLRIWETGSRTAARCINRCDLERILSSAGVTFEDLKDGFDQSPLPPLTPNFVAGLPDAGKAATNG